MVKTMDYEKAYNEAIKRAKAIIEVAEKEEEVYKSAITIFPELYESEDERVRKAILELVRQSSEVLDRQNQNNMIAWLEKQGDKKTSNKTRYKFKCLRSTKENERRKFIILMVTV